MEKKNGGRMKAIALFAIIVLLIAASFKLQMELNRLREEYYDMQKQADELRIERDRLKEQYELLEKDPDAYLAQKAKTEGYYDPDSQRILNDMPNN